LHSKSPGGVLSANAGLRQSDFSFRFARQTLVNFGTEPQTKR
jgi:hypothetical protein